MASDDDIIAVADLAPKERTDLRAKCSLYLDEFISDNFYLGECINGDPTTINGVPVFAVMAMIIIPNFQYPYEPVRHQIRVGEIHYNILQKRVFCTDLRTMQTVVTNFLKGNTRIQLADAIQALITKMTISGSQQ